MNHTCSHTFVATRPGGGGTRWHWRRLTQPRWTRSHTFSSLGSRISCPRFPVPPLAPTAHVHVYLCFVTAPFSTRRRRRRRRWRVEAFNWKLTKCLVRSNDPFIILFIIRPYSEHKGHVILGHEAQPSSKWKHSA